MRSAAQMAIMRTMRLHSPAGLDRLEVVDLAEPPAPGPGEVLAIGDGVKEFKPGDVAVSTFFSEWVKGGPMEGGFSRTPGDGIDG